MPHIFKPSTSPSAAASPATTLQQEGPLLQVVISQPDVIAQYFVTQGLPVPAPITGMALVDTGASHCGIDSEVAAQLGLPVINQMSVSTPSTSSEIKNVYPVKVEVVATQWRFQVQAVGHLLSGQGLVMLIGRDALAECQLTYNGSFGFFTISF